MRLQNKWNTQLDRIEWVDVAKGIGILLVVLGHTLSWEKPNEKIFRDMLYSFHMPLFFVLSGITSKVSNTADELIVKIEKSFFRLILPVIGYWALKVFLLSDCNNVECIVANINELIYANGVDVKVMFATVPALGIVWFMVSLFFAKNLFNYINYRVTSSEKKFVIALLCGIIGATIGHFQWLPFTFDLVLVVIPFFYIGSILNNYDLSKRVVIKVLLTGIVWQSIFWVYHVATDSYFDLSWRWHPMYPLSDIGAVCGSLFVIFFSILINKSIVALPLKYLGRNTLVFYWIHVFDSKWNVFYKTNNVLIGFIMRVVIDWVLLCIILNACKFIKEQLVKRN